MAKTWQDVFREFCPESIKNGIFNEKVAKVWGHSCGLIPYLSKNDYEPDPQKWTIDDIQRIVDFLSGTPEEPSSEPIVDGARNFSGGHFFQVKNIILDSELIKKSHIREKCTTGPYRIAAYMVLSRRANKKHQCWGGIQDIANLTGMNYSTAERAIKDLVFLGFIIAKRRKKPNGSRDTHLYTLLNVEIDAPEK